MSTYTAEESWNLTRYAA